MAMYNVKCIMNEKYLKSQQCLSTLSVWVFCAVFETSLMWKAEYTMVMQTQMLTEMVEDVQTHSLVVYHIFLYISLQSTHNHKLLVP